jgi:leucyl/phenylalanyl-tRNA--protein transferase
MSTDLTPEALLDCYRRGVFPMAESSEDDTLFLVDPHTRGIIPLDNFHVPQRLARTVRSEKFAVTIDQDFAGVMQGCAAPAPDRRQTWINAHILALYSALHKDGYAHSVECRADGQLVGGLYGVAIGGAFFGESMFTTARDASKIALVYLIARLIVGRFSLLDAQFYTPHLGQFGCETLSRAAFKRRLAKALQDRGDFFALPQDASGAQILQSITQTS